MHEVIESGSNREELLKGDNNYFSSSSDLSNRLQFLNVIV